jgi:hypothetical protein
VKQLEGDIGLYWSGCMNSGSDVDVWRYVMVPVWGGGRGSTAAALGRLSAHWQHHRARQHHTLEEVRAPSSLDSLASVWLPLADVVLKDHCSVPQHACKERGLGRITRLPHPLPAVAQEQHLPQTPGNRCTVGKSDDIEHAATCMYILMYVSTYIHMNIIMQSLYSV